jgi:hypothetical protein
LPPMKWPISRMGASVRARVGEPFLSTVAIR